MAGAAGKVIDFSPRASDIDGRALRMLGDSFSSLVDRLDVDSGGEMYPEPEFGNVTAAPEEYGGGGPEYMTFELSWETDDMFTAPIIEGR